MKNLITTGLLLLTLALFWKIDLISFLRGQEVMWDLDIYYQIAVDVRQGADPYDLPYMETAGPPAVIIPYLPLSFFSLATARSVMVGLSLISAWFSCWLLASHLFKTHRFQWALLLHFLLWLTFLPRYNLNVGQPNLLLMLGVTSLLATTSLPRQSLSVALITLVKTHYLVAWGSLLIQPKTLLVAGLILAGITVASLPIIKPQFYWKYFTQRASHYLMSAPPIPDLDYYNQSLRSTLSRLHLAEFYPLVLLVILALGIAHLLETGDIQSGLLLSLLVSPIVWQHYLVVAYPIAVLSLDEAWQRNHLPWYLIFGSGLLVLHLPWLHGQPVALVPGILASHYYWGLLLLWLSRLNRRVP